VPICDAIGGAVEHCRPMVDEHKKASMGLPGKDHSVSKIRVALVSLWTILALATVGMLGTLTFYAITDHMADAAERATDVNPVSLASQVTGGLQNMVDTNESTKGYQIHFGSDLTLIRLTAGGNEYRGLVTAKTKKGTQVPVLVTVYADRTGTMVYQMDPPSNLRLTQIASDEQRKECYSQC
jgi:hypothetical protein